MLLQQPGKRTRRSSAGIKVEELGKLNDWRTDFRVIHIELDVVIQSSEKPSLAISDFKVQLSIVICLQPSMHKF